MATDKGEEVMLELVTAFSAIGDTSTTWAQTMRPEVVRAKVYDVNAFSKPVISIPGMYEAHERITQGNPARYQTQATIPVRCHFSPGTFTPATDASAWKHDLKKAVRDHFLNHKVFDVAIVNTVTNLPLPDELDSCRIAMDLLVKWDWSEDDPSGVT